MNIILLYYNVMKGIYFRKILEGVTLANLDNFNS